MNIVAVSNLYPPFYIGGYELGCRDVLNGLQARQHSVFVLTSTYGVGSPIMVDNVFRQLMIYRYRPTRDFSTGKLRLLQIERWNNRIFRRLVDHLHPDVIQFWNMRGLSMSLLASAQRTGLPISYAISDPWLMEAFDEDDWLNVWNSIPDAPVRAALKRALKLPGLEHIIDRRIPTKRMKLGSESVFFTSKALQRQYLAGGLRVEHGEIIHWGISLPKQVAGRKPPVGRPIRLLFCGRLVTDKGVHTALEAMGCLLKAGYRDIALTVVGRSSSVEYQEQLRILIEKGDLDAYVEFHGFLPRVDMLDMYHSHDVLLFPSIWKEPFAITILEAMASGLVVVGTTRGGSAEILEHGANSLVFEPGNAGDLASKIEELIRSPELWAKLSAEGRRTIIERFSLEKMVDRVEAHLKRTIERFH